MGQATELPRRKKGGQVPGGASVTGVALVGAAPEGPRAGAAVAGSAVAVGAAAAVSVLSASSSACFVITTMLMRRLIGLSGCVLSKSTDEASPTTRAILSSGSPPTMSARRAALARSADSSQLE